MVVESGGAMHLDDRMSFSTRELELKTFRTQQTVESIADIPHVRESMTMSMESHIWGDDYKSRVVDTYHKDWKEVLKDKFLPQWLKRKFPIAMVEVKVDLMELYPDMRVELADQQRHMRVSVTKSNYQWPK